mgnify:CR=1 FL=1
MTTHITKKPFFSVIIPTYNTLSYLKKAVGSVLKQTFTNYEIIIIDNHSSDGTEKWVKELKKENIQFTKIHNKGQIAKSRNLGIKLSSSNWIAFLDSDDIWYENRLEATYKILKQSNDLDVVCNNEIFVSNGNKRIWKSGPYKNNFYKNLIKYGNCISTSATVVNKNFLVKNNIFFSENISFSPIEDFEFWMRIAKIEAKFKFTEYAHGEHLFHKESYGAKNPNTIKKSMVSILKHHIFEIQNFINKKKELWSHVESRLLIDEAIELFISKKYLNSIFLFFKTLLRYPIKLIINILYKLT